ncbi:MAG: portal protein [Bdellovibrionales bacterium]
MATPYKQKSKSSEDLIATAKKRFALAEEFESEIRALALEDWKFRAGDQWPSEIKKERDADNRPTLVINRVLPAIRQVTNDQRQNRPSLKTYPVDDKADIETAKILNGMLRHIEQDSGADVAYDTAFDGASTGGFGYIRVNTEYVDPFSFDQQIVIEPIDDHFSVYFDPNSKRPDGRDANWAFIVLDMPKEDYDAEYGDSDLAQSNDWESLGNSNDWIKKDTVRIAEYFYKEFKNVKLVQLSTGEVIAEEALTKLFPGGVPDGVVINTRNSKVPVIKWCKLNGHEILEETEWPGRWIPIVPVYGDKYVLDGKRVLEGIVRHAKDPQRMYNYWKSTETETITLAPKSPYIVAEGQIPKQYEAMWKTANKKSWAYLPYKPTTHESHLVPPPQRNVFEPPVQAITQAGLFAADDLKSTTGIYDAALGAKSNENSGIAIQRRNQQSQTTNFHLIDNLTRSIRHVGRICVDLIPKIYDAARAQRILGEDGEQEIVRINEVFKKGGEDRIYDLGAGKYDVVCETGPSYATKRQEAAETTLELTKSAPVIMQAAPDLVIKTLDIPQAQEIADRLKRTLPPGIADSDDDKKPLPPQVQAQMAQMNQMIEQLTASLNDANEKVNTKVLELESKERIEMKKLEVEVELKRAELDSKEGLALLHSEIEQINQRLALLGVDQPIEKESAGPDQAGFSQPQPTGGPSPGQFME